MKLIKALCVCFVFAAFFQSCAAGGGHQKCAAYSQNVVDESPEMQDVLLNAEENKDV